MNFADLYQIVQEAKLRLCKIAFGEQHVDSIGQDRLRIDFGDRHLYIDVDPKTQLNFNKIIDMPSLYMSFDWNYETSNGKRPDATTQSYKDPHNDDDYLVHKTLQQETMEALHKLRDGVFRKLASYSIYIKYIPAGDRRSSFYASVLQSCGFREVKKNVWLPSSLYLPGVV